MLDFRLETFLTICDCMNYRKTAELLHITQPAVSQQIHHLEKEYGCKLFQYENRTLTKTREAEILEKYARAVRLQDRTMRELLQKKRGCNLRIGATKTIGDYVLKDYVSRYLSTEENELFYYVANTRYLLRELEDNQLDFAVIEGFFDKNKFDSVLLRKEPFVGICHKDHPFAGKKVPIEKLFSETIIHRENGSGTRAVLEQELEGYNDSLSLFHRQICISNFPMILHLVKTGIGISFVYNVLADSDPELGKFWIDGDSIVREFNIVFLKYADLQEKIQCFFGA